LFLFGPPGIIDCVEGKLRGYTWNLVDNYDFAIEVSEVAVDTIRRALFPAATGFQPEELPTLPFTGVLLDEPAFSVRTAHLDHRIYSLGFSLEEKTHLNVDKDLLNRLGVPTGPWLADLKNAVRRGEPDDFVVTAHWRQKDGQEHQRDFALGEVRGRLVKETRGQKITYVVDTIYTPDNAVRIAALAQGADLFFCESPFVVEDEAQATRRYHLTTRQAGLLARAAGVRKLIVFHFSPRYAGQAERMYREAQEAFRGEEQDGVREVEGGEHGGRTQSEERGVGNEGQELYGPGNS
jgi:ribonuclease Z